MINEGIRVVDRGLDECQRAFELLIDAFVYAKQESIQ